MLNIYTAVCLDTLADNMIEKIKEAWKNPFEAPVVIFPDSKVAQWFKFRWLEKNSALANLNVKKLDDFIFESIVDENKDYKLLTQDILRNLIIAYLEKNFKKSSNEKIFDEIKEYLYDEKNEIATPLTEARNDGNMDEIVKPLTDAHNDDSKNEIATPPTAKGSQPPQSFATQNPAPPQSGGASSEKNDDSKKELNYARLFDFAEMLSGIFLEYEYSRVASSKNNDGIIDSWLNDKDYFKPNSENAKIKEEWQKNIYFDIFSENGHLRQANEKLKSDNEIIGNCITLPQLFSEKYKDIMDCHGSTSLAMTSGGVASSNSVFLFGFDSMKQFYINAIKELSAKLNINLYLANPFGDVAKESNNELLKYWGNSGKRNIELWWKLSNEFESLDNNRNYSQKADSLKIPLDPPLKKGARREADSKNNESNLMLLQRAIVENKKEINRQGSTRFDHAENAKTKVVVNDSNNSNSSNNSNLLQDESLVMISAPTKLREVEILHSNICKLLINKKAQIKDIIVASPNLDAYRSVIYQVFSQSPQKAEDNSSQKAALHIPFSIVDSSDNESLTHLALKRLFSLKEKGVLSRPDFFDLVRNPVVQAARGILPDEISNWEGWISSLNIYRDRKLDDEPIEKNWLTGVKSLLLAKLTNQDIVVNYGLPRLYEPRNDESNNKVKEITISPFSDIASSDNESVCRFIDCIDDIEDWLKIGGGASNVLDEAFSEIEKWLLMNKVPSGLGNENYIFQKIKKAKDELKWQYAAGSESISWKIFSKTLLNASSKAKYNTGNLFVNGITFMNFVPNRVIPTKFMFLLGIDEKTFPRKDYKNSLDLRTEMPINSDELNSEKDKFAFLNQFLNVKETIYISYVNKDLQKDEDFYPSSVIDDILRYFKKLGKNLEIEKAFNIENRDWKELFTQSALRNKETYEIMMDRDNKYKKEKIPSDTSEGLQRQRKATLCSPLSQQADSSHTNGGGASKGKCPEKVTVYQLRSFLEEPFRARIERILLSEDEEDAEKIEFEPIEINNLEQSKIKKQLVLFGLENKYDFSDSNQNEEFENKFNEIVAKQSIEFPQGKFGEKVRNELINLSKEYINHIKDVYRYEDGYNYKSLDLSVNFEISNNKKLIWNLSGTANIVAEKNNEVHIIDLVNSGIYPYSYMNSYILALLYLANSNKSNIVFIDLFNEDVLHDSVPINFESEKAYSIINDIYKKIFIENYHKVLPISLFNVEELDYQTYVGKFDDDYGPWSYFSARKLFDIRDEEISDFTEENFYDEWKAEKEKQLDLFPNELKVKIVGEKK